MKKRSLALLVLALVCVSSLTPLLAACNTAGGGITGGGADTLVNYNWEDYIDIGLLDEFAAYYRGVTGRSLSITYSTFDTNETHAHAGHARRDRGGRRLPQRIRHRTPHARGTACKSDRARHGVFKEISRRLLQPRQRQ